LSRKKKALRKEKLPGIFLVLLLFLLFKEIKGIKKGGLWPPI